LIVADIAAMRAERDELDRLITEAEQDAAAAYREALDSIQETLRFWARSADQVIAETQRKNVTSLHINGVHVELSYPVDQRNMWLAVRWGNGSSAVFSGDAPPAGVIVGMVKELLLNYPGTPQEGN
jgi:hypothetical protein